MYEIGVSTRFEAAHRLHGDFGPATRVHGHSYRLDAIVRGPRLRSDGTLLDITIVQGALAAIVADLHYRDLDEVPDLAGINTTAEEVAAYCWRRIAAALQVHPEATHLSVRIWENSDVYGGYSSDL
ncbi:MAG: 6-carboxytetrahydropterin synthase [Oscillochloris sp.]|nr:6-carboxytetrahydropterin synthase [Oscillochloris sp.]